MTKMIRCIFLLCFVLCINLNTAFTQKNTLNDVHSKLNKTIVEQVIFPQSIQDIVDSVMMANKNGISLSISAGKHAMGGQQFGTGTINLDMSKYNRVVSFDSEKGIIEVESGIQWPDLIDWLIESQKGVKQQWGIRQKQTGADNLSLGGALSANVHGRGLTWKPIVGDVESFTLVDADGRLITCSRTENKELFRLVIGGYGLFGVIATIKLRLGPRIRLKRLVEITSAKDIIAKIDDRIKQGYLYGDFQFSIDPKSDSFLIHGVFSAYRPILNDIDETTAEQGKELSADQWRQLYFWAHTNKSKAYDTYTKFYQSTNGQEYWSDTHQLSIYIDDYHASLDQALKSSLPGSEMISEVYVPRKYLYRFLKNLRADFRKYDVDVIYGTVRFIEKDDETFLPWANQRYASIVFNFHVDHDAKGIEKAKRDFRRLIDRALEFEGSYYLTYHRWARRDQILKAYPQFPHFLELKRKYDPNEIFQSDWYRHYRKMFKEKK